MNTHDHLVSALQRLCRASGGYQTVAAAAGVSPDNLWQILNGTLLKSGKPRGIGAQLAAKLDKAYPGWTQSQHLLEGRPKGAVAHIVSDPTNSQSALVYWGEIVKSKLPTVFRVAAPDDSMAPRVRMGQVVEFSTAEKPRAGDGVLVQDSIGDKYFRLYRERRPGFWEAHPINDAYQPLDSERDGLVVLAVLVAVHSRWS